MNGGRLVCLVLLLSLLGCSSPAPPSSPPGADKARLAEPSPAGKTAAGGAPSDNVLVAVQGQIAIKRASWSQFVPAVFGTLIRLGDELRLEGSSIAKIACADLSLVTVRAGAIGVPCQVVKPILLFQGSAIRATRADSGGGFPTVVAPRKTNLLAERPLIRWTPIAGATGYRVSVRGPNVNWSADVSGKTEFPYPDDAPPLAPGQAFKVTVVATTAGGNRSSDEEAQADLGFVPLEPEQRQAVQEAQARIEKLDLEEAQQRFLIAKLYMSQDFRLYGEAIEQLERLGGTLKEAAVGRSLADTYRAVSLNRLAEQRYLQALELSQQTNDLEGQALALDSLGQLYTALGNPSEARQRTQQAEELYQQLGDAEAVKKLQERLAGLPKP
jgi:hypothetical protein